MVPQRIGASPLLLLFAAVSCVAGACGGGAANPSDVTASGGKPGGTDAGTGSTAGGSGGAGGAGLAPATGSGGTGAGGQAVASDAGGVYQPPVRPDASAGGSPGGTDDGGTTDVGTITDAGSAPDVDPMSPDSGMGGNMGAGGANPGAEPGAFKVFDRIPQFGMYATANPAGYTPPAGVLMWNFGSFFVARLSEEQQSHIGSNVAARITYHAQCDNYDRLATVFLVNLPKGQSPKPTDPRVELVRFITPFSDYTRGTLATRVYPDADLAPYARTLADPSHDVWIGIGGGSNPYDGDPCTNANVTPEFRSIGYKFSLELISTKALAPLAAGAPGTTVLPGVYYMPAMAVPVTAMVDNPGAELTGKVTVIVSGHGSAAGGVEYRHTQDTVSVNGKAVGTFATQIDCAPFAALSPDGNQGIFRNNTTTANPRNWCPGALVAARSFPATLVAGKNTISLGVNPADVPSGSYYSTSINFVAP